MFGLANIFSPRLGLHANVIIHVSLLSFIAFGLAKEPVNGRLILTAKAMKNKQVHKRVHDEAQRTSTFEAIYFRAPKSLRRNDIYYIGCPLGV